MSAPTRPSSVTSACLFVGFSCFVLLSYVVQALSSWGSIETQEQMSSLLSERPFDSLDVSVDEALDGMRLVLFVAVAICLLGVVFAIYTARGHSPSRVALTVVCAFAAVGFVMTGIIGVLLAAFAVSSAFMLWSQESRDWFALKNGRTPPVRVPRAPRAVPSTDPFVQQPGAQHQVALQERPAPPVGAGGIPREVMIASVTMLVTWLTVGVAALFVVLVFLFTSDSFANSTTDPALLEQIEKLRETTGDVGPGLAGAAFVLGLLSLVGAAAAVAGLLRRSIGRMGMLVLSYGGILVSAMVLPYGVLWAGAAVVTIVLLNRPVSRAWFTRA